MLSTIPHCAVNSSGPELISKFLHLANTETSI